MASSDQTLSSSLGVAYQSYSDAAYSTGFNRYSVNWKLWLIWFGLFFFLSMFLPRDAHFDVAHYHIHNGWSLWNGRLEQDLAPAQLHSFMNPLHSGLIWLLIDNLPGPLAVGVLSLVQAAMLPMLYALIARLAYRFEADVSKTIIAIIAFACFITQPMSIMLSSLLNDHWGALAFITALVLLIGKTAEPPTLRAFGLASACLGLMLGLKMTNAVYVPAFAVAAMIAVPGLVARVKAAAICAAAGLGGMVLTGGWWAAIMMDKFGNPVFPHLNSLFGSPADGPSEAFRDHRYLPEGMWDALIRPFKFSFDGTLINEYHFYDFRFLIGYLVCFVGLALFARAALQKRLTEAARPALILIAAFLVTMIVWSMVFSIQRYAMGLWLIGLLIPLVMLWYYRPDALSHSKIRIAAFAVLGAVIISTSYASLRRAAWTSWDEPYVWTKLPDTVDVTDAIIVMSARYPTAYTAPAMQRAAWITHADARPWSRAALENYRPRIKAAIAASDNPVFAIMFIGQDSDEDDLVRLAGEVGLIAHFNRCERMGTAFNTLNTHWVICPLGRP